LITCRADWLSAQSTRVSNPLQDAILPHNALLLAGYRYTRQKTAAVAAGEIEQLKSVFGVVADPRRPAVMAFTIPAGAELFLFELLSALRNNEYLGFLNTSCVPGEVGGTLFTAGLDPTGIRLGSDFSPRFLRRYGRGKQKQA
jgi:hypothetical protein